MNVSIYVNTVRRGAADCLYDIFRLRLHISIHKFFRLLNEVRPRIYYVSLPRGHGLPLTKPRFTFCLTHSITLFIEALVECAQPDLK